ncbi:MAG TPA: hypothetical protein HPQ04_07130 [Rhodospirillaceae bacterium]|nr:hypothetical protein [Rhodospirillaceae bacterium]
MRILIEYILPVVLPTVLWLAWLVYAQGRAKGQAKGQENLDWQAVPWTWLLAAGLALAMVIATGLTLTEGYRTGGYHPAAIDEHGRMIPGRID